MNHRQIKDADCPSSTRALKCAYEVATFDSFQAAWNMRSNRLDHVNHIGPYGGFPSGRNFQPGWTLPVPLGLAVMAPSAYPLQHHWVVEREVLF